MTEAFAETLFLYQLDQPVNLFMIRLLAEIIDPRNTGELNEDKLNQLNQLIENQLEMSADRFCYQLEKIHPFSHGNGRLGVILWNYLRNSMISPLIPPKV